MPANVRVQEIPGLIKRYKEGVPGWELREADFPGLIGDAKVIPRQDLLDRVRQQSPVYTHKEIVLGGNAPGRSGAFKTSDGIVRFIADAQDAASPLGQGIHHGKPRYADYGQGGDSYAELLLLQPGAERLAFNSHWRDAAQRTSPAVAHARFDTHGDALRINELQSDLGIQNRMIRESAANQSPPPVRGGDESESAFIDRAERDGWQVVYAPGGELKVVGRSGELPFPLEDSWSDLLIKRLALEAAQKGHRAIEVASPRAIADKVGGNIDNYEHFYGKVVPGALERLGRKMGGLVEDVPASRQAETKSVWDESEDLLNQYRRFNQGEPERIDAFNDLLDASSPATQRDAAYRIYEMFNDGDPGYATAVTRDAIALAEQTNAARAVRERLLRQGIGPPIPPPGPAGRRYLMSDEMRRRLIEQGVGASVLAPLLMTGEER
jgi:hypothetical protein